MKTRARRQTTRFSAGLAWGTLCAAALLPAPAHADPPRTAGALQLGAGFRYGVDLEDAEPDPWGVGLGLELGYTMQNAVYLGGVFDYFLGETITTQTTTGETWETTANVWQVAAEGGYDLQLSDGVLVRPKLGLGIATGRVDCDACGISESETSFAAAPGLTTMFFPGSLVFSLDARYQMVFADEMASALIFSLGIGF